MFFEHIFIASLQKSKHICCDVKKKTSLSMSLTIKRTEFISLSSSIIFLFFFFLFLKHNDTNLSLVKKLSRLAIFLTQ
jgi:hypothetical protein